MINAYCFVRAHTHTKCHFMILGGALNVLRIKPEWMSMCEPESMATTRRTPAKKKKHLGTSKRKRKRKIPARI